MAKTAVIILVVILILVAIPVMLGIDIKNKLVTLDENSNNAWGRGLWCVGSV